MVKTIIAVAGFAAVILIGTPGYSAAAVGCDRGSNCDAIAAKPAPTARIETVNLAAGALLRQIVGDATAHGNQAKR